MLTGKAAKLRPDINDLHVTPIVLVSEGDAPQPYAADGEHADMLRAQSRDANAKRMQESRARNARDIPTSGPGRRRAKQHRNRGLCLERVAGGKRCAHDAVDGTGRCARHTKQATE
jgi:hypothetical protein